MTLVTLDEAKDQCRIRHSDDDDRIERIRDQAESIVIDYMKVDSEDDLKVGVGSPEVATLPFFRQAAILLVIENLYYRSDQDPLSPAVVSLLIRSRDPALA